MASDTPHLDKLALARTPLASRPRPGSKDRARAELREHLIRTGRAHYLPAAEQPHQREYERMEHGREEHVRGHGPVTVADALRSHLLDVHGEADYHLYGHDSAEDLDALHHQIHQARSVLGPRLLHEDEPMSTVHARSVLGPGYEPEPSAAPPPPPKKDLAGGLLKVLTGAERAGRGPGGVERAVAARKAARKEPKLPRLV